MVMKVKSTHPESQGEYVLIDEADFDPEKHERYEEFPQEKPAAQPRKPKRQDSEG